MESLRTLEWSVVALALVAVAVALWRRLPARSPGRWIVPAVAMALLAGGVAWDRRRSEQESREAAFQARLPVIGRPGGYVSSDTCRACHPSQYQSWHDSYHRTMTQRVSLEAVQADFTPTTLRGAGEEARIWREGDAFWAELPDPEHRAMLRERGDTGPSPTVRRRLGLMTGSHHMQAFWVPSTRGNQQLIFPFAWLVEDRQWAPVHTTFLRDPALPPATHVWNLNCLKCHATAGQPRPDPAVGGLATRLGDLSISCEACHGPAEEHVRWYQNPLNRLPAKGSTTPAAHVVNPARLPKAQSAQACGQCHGIKWIPAAENFRQEGFRFRPGQDLDASTPIVRPTHWREQPFLQAGLRQNPKFLDEHYWPDGMVRVSGRDFSGTVESPCFQKGEMSCLSCHSMHSPASRVDQLAPGKESNAACLQCHESFRGRESAHSHHPAGSAGDQCYNCHMPHTTYGLLKAIRSHQVSSPSTVSSLRTGRPNACNLCHLDQSLDWTARRLEAWYRQPRPQLPPEHQDTAASVVWALQGDAGQRALMAWHFGWEPARQASGADWIPPHLGQLLTDPYSAVRLIARRSLRRLPGHPIPDYDPLGPAEGWERARQEVVSRWAKDAPRTHANPRVLVSQGPTLDAARIDALLRRRDNRSMDLQE